MPILSLPLPDAVLVDTYTTPLAGSGLINTDPMDVAGYTSISVIISSDVSSTASLVLLSHSPDGVDWDYSDATSFVAGTPYAQVVAPKARFFRMTYANGATAQAHFRLQIVATP